MSALARRVTLGLALACVVATGGCRGKPASERDCETILDRIVELELGEQGFRDAVLAERKKRELRRLLAPELASCVDRRLPKKGLECLRTARSSEEVSHRCLR